jgi:hypothetical protein
LNAPNVDGSILPNDKSTECPDLLNAGMNVLASVANRDVPLESSIDANKITSPNKRNLPVRCLVDIGNIDLESELPDLESELPLWRASLGLELAVTRSFVVSMRTGLQLNLQLQKNILILVPELLLRRVVVLRIFSFGKCSQD